MTEKVNANESRRAYLIGGGIASLAAAAYLIKEGQFEGELITIIEESGLVGGSLDGGGNSLDGYVSRGGRMLNFSYQCTYDLLSFIPSIDDPNRSVLTEIEEFNEKNRSSPDPRMSDDGVAMDVSGMGFTKRDKLDLIEIMEASEHSLSGKKINEWFESAFFESNFWFLWATLFAFQPWHSAIEFKRYLHRYIHRINQINSMIGVDRTPFNQFESIVRPLIQFLRNKGVKFEMGAEVTHIGFGLSGSRKSVERIEFAKEMQIRSMEVAANDIVMVTIGSITSDSRVGSMTTVPELITTHVDGGWRLWESLAKDNADFGRPWIFNSRIEESKWESFTVTCKGDEFFKRLDALSGDGGRVTFRNSNWLMSIVLAHQPYFRDQPSDVTVFWGYGLFPDKEGNFVKRKMSDCTGREIITEIIHHLKLEDFSEALLLNMNCIPCMMPYITSQFLTRKEGDRPLVVPESSTNLAFIGQFAEVPDDVVFTMEYSVRTAQTAVYTLLNLDKKPLPVDKGTHHFNALAEHVNTTTPV